MSEEIKEDNNCIVKAFETNPISILKENINDKKIYYFKASDIGKALGIVNIRSTIQNYDDDERVVRNVYDPQGTPQDTIFLSSQGVYRLLYNSKKDIAKKFRKWAGNILDDIIFNESQELKRQLEEHEQKLLEKDKVIEEKEKLIEDLQKPPFYTVPKSQWVYIFQEICKKGQNIYKVGLTKKCVDKRKKSYKTYASDGFEEVYKYKTHNCYLLESIVKQLLYKYRYGHESEKGGTEYYQANIEYIKNIIKISGSIIDSLYGTNDNITSDDFIKHINTNLIEEMYGTKDFLKTFLPECITKNFQLVFDLQNNNLKNTLQKRMNKEDFNKVTDKMCDKFNNSIQNIIS